MQKAVLIDDGRAWCSPLVCLFYAAEHCPAMCTSFVGQKVKVVVQGI